MAVIPARVIALVVIFGVLVTCAYWATVNTDTRDKSVNSLSLNEELGRAQKTREAIRNRSLSAGMESKSMKFEQHKRLRKAECEQTGNKSPCIEAITERPRSQHPTYVHASPNTETSLQDQDRCEATLDKSNQIADISKDDESCSLKSSQAVNEMLTQQIESLLWEHEQRIQKLIKQSISNMQQSQEQPKQSSPHEESNDVTSRKDELWELAWTATLGVYMGTALLTYFLTLIAQTENAREWLLLFLFVSAFIEWSIWNSYKNQIDHEEDLSHWRLKVTFPEHIANEIWGSHKIICTICLIILLFPSIALVSRVMYIILYAITFIYAKATGMSSDRMEEHLSLLRYCILGRINDLQNAEIAQPASIAGTREDVGRDDGENTVTNSSQSSSTERTNGAVSAASESTTSENRESPATSGQTDSQRRIPFVVSRRGSITIGRYDFRQRTVRNGQSPLRETVQQFVTFMLIIIPRRSAIRRENHRRFLANARRNAPRDRTDLP